MIKSSPILPLRVYDDVFDQHRFNVHASHAQQAELIYPSNALPSFQFRRDKSLLLPEKLILRNTCDDADYLFGYYKEVPEPATIFGSYAAPEFFGAFPLTQGVIFDDGINPPVGGTLGVLGISCSALIPIALPPNYTLSGPGPSLVIPISEAGEKYTFKIIVDRFKKTGGSSLAIKIYTGGAGGTLIGTITASGVYTFDFTSVDDEITVFFDGYTNGDFFQINYVQALLNTFEGALTNGMLLDETKLKVLPIKDGTDIVTYCEANQPYIPQSGTYYYIVVDNGKYYFSELFQVRTLLEIEKYYRLKWRHSCDINSQVIYNEATIECAFWNELYLDAALFKPEPETKEDGTEDESGELNVTSSTWKKFINFEILKSPEFLTDALSAVLLHNEVLLKLPLGNHQLINNNEYTVKQIIPDVSSVMKDCFQKVNLKLLIFDAHTSSACCTQAEVFNCSPCTYTATSDCSGDYRLQTTLPPEEGDGLYNCANNELVEVLEDDLICYDGKYIKLVLLDNIWQIEASYPNIASITLVGLYLVIVGKVLPHTFAQVEYNKDGAGWVIAGTSGSDASGNYTINLLNSLTSGASDFKIRIRSKTLNCDYGISTVNDYI